MTLWEYISGTAVIRVTSADTAGALSALNSVGIILQQVTQTEDPLCVVFTLKKKDIRAALYLLSKRGEEALVLERNGLFFMMLSMLKRPVLLLGIGLLTVLTFYLSTRVLFLRVEGNGSVPTNRIIEVCMENGLHFGAPREAVRSERIKNILLESIPQLKWAGVNTQGCVATISVRERSDGEKTKNQSVVGSIRARCDGIVTDVTVTRGHGICTRGQAVRAGQVLISGYTDCGISIRAEQAQGEIYADTNHAITAYLPCQINLRGEILRQEQKFSLIIGKKRINLYKDSGISGDGCVKMYSDNYVTLPGGFILPLAIVTETWIYYEETEAAVSEVAARNLLKSFAQRYLTEQMIALKILSCEEEILQQDGAYVLSGRYACNEMIGVFQKEELIKPNG